MIEGAPGSSVELALYAAVVDGEPVAPLAFASALAGSLRGAAMGWSLERRTERLPDVVSHARFVILRASLSRIWVPRARLTLRWLSADWQAVHGHPVSGCETCVDPAHFLGAVYPRAGFTYLGATAGVRRQARGYTAHAHPKRVYLRPLRRHLLALLRQEFLTPALLDRGCR